MSRLVLLVLLAILTWFYFPETRTMLLDFAEPVVVPIVTWSTTEEMRQIARNVVEHRRLTGQMPSGAAWLGWLDYRYATPDLRTDPWGSVYQLEVSQDSVWILSLGPDRTRATDDDFRVAAPIR
jgi:hypothetical protein